MYHLFNNLYSAFYPRRVYGFHMILRVNSDYFPKHHWVTDLRNIDVLCFISGKNHIFKYKI
jgi:hypothetical protein